MDLLRQASARPHLSCLFYTSRTCPVPVSCCCWHWVSCTRPMLLLALGQLTHLPRSVQDTVKAHLNLDAAVSLRLSCTDRHDMHQRPQPLGPLHTWDLPAVARRRCISCVQQALQYAAGSDAKSTHSNSGPLPACCMASGPGPGCPCSAASRAGVHMIHHETQYDPVPGCQLMLCCWRAA